MYSNDFAYVFSEIERIASLDVREIMKSSPSESFAMLPHPSGRGSLMCGIGAYRRLQEVSERGLARSNHAGTIEVAAVFNALKNIWVKRFLCERRKLSPQESERAVAAAVKFAAKAKKTLTHYVPCHLGHAKKPDTFCIGPVRFRQRQSTFRYLKPKLKQYIEEDASKRDLAEKLAAHTTRYYRSFGWVAEVTIADCDTGISRDRADRIVQRSLDCLHLLIGPSYSSHMRAGGVNFSTDRRGRIELDGMGRAEVMTSVDWLSHNLGDNWWNSINSEGGSDVIELMGVALEAGHALPRPAPLAQRFLDGVAWFGEAVRDDFVASRIIKYVTAVERVLITKNEEKLSETLASRGAALLHERGLDDIEALRQRFLDVYELRSRLVHGSRSPLDRSFGPGLIEAADLSRSVLLNALMFFRRNGLRSQKISLRQLDKSYATLIEWARETGANASSTTTSGADAAEL